MYIKYSQRIFTWIRQNGIEVNQVPKNKILHPSEAFNVCVDVVNRPHWQLLLSNCLDSYLRQGTEMLTTRQLFGLEHTTKSNGVRSCDHAGHIK